ncbi:MAG: type II secretion system protein [Anaerohalosphaera sp.]|nr:type II secretion system protein [Anaerohalosphaera sp.]
MLPTRENKTAPGGFTLIEILAAMVLIIVVIPAVMKGISVAIAVASDSAFKAEAAALAQNKLAEILIEETWQSSNVDGDFGDDYPGYRWKMTSENWTEPGLNEITVEVLWESRGSQREVKLSTLVRTDE